MKELRTVGGLVFLTWSPFLICSFQNAQRRPMTHGPCMKGSRSREKRSSRSLRSNLNSVSSKLHCICKLQTVLYATAVHNFWVEDISVCFVSLSERETKASGENYWNPGFLKEHLLDTDAALHTCKTQKVFAVIKLHACKVWSTELILHIKLKNPKKIPNKLDSNPQRMEKYCGFVALELML